MPDTLELDASKKFDIEALRSILAHRLDSCEGSFVRMAGVKAVARAAGLPEREAMCALLDAGFIDTFRHFYPDQSDIYSWWSYRFQARQKNVGWRIDYFVTSENLRDRFVDAKIHTEIFGSDHCPVELTLE